MINIWDRVDEAIATHGRTTHELEQHVKPEDVPDELARAAVEGYYGHTVPDGGFAVLRGQWQRALAAVLPAHEKQVRAKIAAEIEAELARHQGPVPASAVARHSATKNALQRAADIARGGDQ